MRILWVVILLFLFSCAKNENYIHYYQEVNRIDSVYRLANQPQLAVKEYKKLFKKYEPKNQERIQEFETYILLSDQYNEDFGGKETLKKLVTMKYYLGDRLKQYEGLFQKYGLQDEEVKQLIKETKQKQNQKLVDSFKIVLERDQEGRVEKDFLTINKNVDRNAKFLLWYFDGYGYPTREKIGEFPMPTLLSHLSESVDNSILREKVLDYVKSGDCEPFVYALMIDGLNLNLKRSTIYRYTEWGALDSATIDKNRKSIGLPSLKHQAVIDKDFFKRLNRD